MAHRYKIDDQNPKKPRTANSSFQQKKLKLNLREIIERFQI